MTTNSVILHVAYDTGLRFDAATPDHQILTVEPSPALGGSGKNPNPIDCLLASLGSCAGIKVFMELTAQNARPEALRITLEGSRRDKPPLVFENLHVTFHFSGPLDEAMVKAAIDEAMTLTCPVAVMLAKATVLTWDFSIRA